MIRKIALTAVFVGLLSLRSDSRAEERVLMHDLQKSSVRARLIGARISETRGRYLIARFKSEAPESREIIVNFPAHSLTVHEGTLQAVIRACTLSEAADGPDDWHVADVAAEFYVPRTAQFDDPEYRGQPVRLTHEHLKRCTLIRLEIPKTK